MSVLPHVCIHKNNRKFLNSNEGKNSIYKFDFTKLVHIALARFVHVLHVRINPFDTASIVLYLHHFLLSNDNHQL